MAKATPVPPSCGSCGAPLQPGFRFCGVCGKPIGTAPVAAPAGPRARLRLTLVRNDGTAGTTWPLEDGEIVCGRSEGAVRLADDATVSPRHARFTAAGGALRVEDLGSVNGTFLRLKAARPISIGEELRVGRQVLRLEPQPRPDAGARAWGSKDRGARFRLAQLLEGGGQGEVFTLHDGENLVGREAGDVTFPSDRYVSARHARIEIRGQRILLADAGSSNGTFVRLAGPAELAAGDQLLVGTQLLRVEG